MLVVAKAENVQHCKCSCTVLISTWDICFMCGFKIALLPCTYLAGLLCLLQHQLLLLPCLAAPLQCGLSGGREPAVRS
jgi:hypothetical protein